MTIHFVRLFLLSIPILCLCSCEANPPKPSDTQTLKQPKKSDPVVEAASQATTRSKPEGELPFFKTVAEESGINFRRNDDIRGLHRILEANGGGVAMFDCDHDGYLDLFFTNGCQLPRTADDGSHGELFHNLDGMRFTSITSASGLVQKGFGYGCAVGDYNSDGFDDLYVTALGPNQLWRNNGDGTFTDVTHEVGVDVPAWSASAAFSDLNGDGHLDLYVVNYLDESAESPRLCPAPGSPDGYVQCSPAVFDGVDDALLISDGTGHFIDQTEQAGLKGLRGKGLGVVVANLDRNGLPEIYVANDGQANFLFSAKSETTEELKYEDHALVAGLAFNEVGYAQASMGVAAGDVNADGFSDLFLTHFYGDTNTLYLNQGELVFDDSTRASAIGPPSRQVLGWGTAFFDYDNNGSQDLIVANGHIDDRTWMPNGEPYRMKPQLFRNEDYGTFREVSEWSGDYFQQTWLGRGLAIGDLDRDGRLDVAISHQQDPSVLLWNQTSTTNNAITLEFIGTKSNRNGFGVVVIRTDIELSPTHELYGGGSFQSANAHTIHLGLNGASKCDIVIHWPSGEVDEYQEIRAGRYHAIENGSLVDSSR